MSFRRSFERIAALFLLIISVTYLEAQDITALEFRNQKITDILMALARISGTSIVADGTVEGTATYYFSETTIEEALTLFLSSYNLYYQKKDGIYYVSRFRTQYDKENKKITLDGEDVPIAMLISELSEETGSTILNDPLPRESITVHFNDLSVQEALEIVFKRFPDYSIEAEDNYYYVKKQTSQSVRSSNTRRGGAAGLERSSSGQYTINAEQIRFRELLEQLFNEEEKEYIFLSRSDSMIEYFSFKEKSFTELLNLLCQSANTDYYIDNGVYYFFDIQSSDVLKSFKNTTTYSFEFLNVKDAMSLIPQEIMGRAQYKVDQQSNSIILMGSQLELEPVLDFISDLDRPNSGRRFFIFEVSHLDVNELINLLPSRFNPETAKVISGSNSFILQLSELAALDLESYIQRVDLPQAGHPVRLRYIRAEELLKRLPPSVEMSNVIETNHDDLIFFLGTEEKMDLFLDELKLIDKPIPQIRYELLVIQYQDGNDLEFGNSMEVSNAEEGASGSSLVAVMDQLIDLSFDIVTTFGYQFAVKLNGKLSTNTAQVFADTTLNGTTGQDIKFQNTNTYRYRETEVEPDTGKIVSTGVTNEITSGLILNINGWVSGDHMITMDVSATVSKQGAISTGTSNLPPTSEKVITTQIRSPSGNPVIIGGLIQQELTEIDTGIPVLRSIPLLGRLFRTTKETYEETEMVIYLVPYLEPNVIESQEMEYILERMYQRHAR